MLFVSSSSSVPCSNSHASANRRVGSAPPTCETISLTRQEELKAAKLCRWERRAANFPSCAFLSREKGALRRRRRRRESSQLHPASLSLPQSSLLQPPTGSSAAQLQDFNGGTDWTRRQERSRLDRIELDPTAGLEGIRRRVWSSAKDATFFSPFSSLNKVRRTCSFLPHPRVSCTRLPEEDKSGSPCPAKEEVQGFVDA